MNILICILNVVREQYNQENVINFPRMCEEIVLKVMNVEAEDGKLMADWRTVRRTGLLLFFCVPMPASTV